MECHNHPDREAVANCAFCGKAVCPECSVEIGGNIYCKDCINEIITKSFGEKEAKEDIAPKETMTKEPAEVFEPIEPITPIQAEEREVEAETLKPVEKAPENFETDYEYETEYVETYEEEIEIVEKLMRESMENVIKLDILIANVSSVKG